VSEFKSWRAFQSFEKEVSRDRRYVRSNDAEKFLDAVRLSLQSRVSRISEGRGFWRAQIGHDWRYEEQIRDEVPTAYKPERMKPLSDRAMEGRANSKGIPALYICSNKRAAMSEVRPWIGSMISLGRFVTAKDLRLVDCSKMPIKTRNPFMTSPPREDWNSLVWSEIDQAFTKPVTRSDNTGDYVATQILVELFRDAGFDGISYRSAFGEESKNIALFDLKSANLESCQLHEATSVNFNFLERDDPYWVKRSKPTTSRRK